MQAISNATFQACPHQDLPEACKLHNSQNWYWWNLKHSWRSQQAGIRNLLMLLVWGLSPACKRLQAC
jgi:hypothetical protein